MFSFKKKLQRFEIVGNRMLQVDKVQEIALGSIGDIIAGKHPESLAIVATFRGRPEDMTCSQLTAIEKFWHRPEIMNDVICAVVGRVVRMAAITSNLDPYDKRLIPTLTKLLMVSEDRQQLYIEACVNGAKIQFN